MDRLTVSQKQSIRFAFVGVLLIVLSFKFMLQGGFDVRVPLNLDGKAALLFFSLDQPCDCMRIYVNAAETQIERWAETQRAGIPIYRIDFDTRRDLASQYGIYRVPSLVLLDSEEGIIYQQDYPLFEEGSFRLAEFEARIHEFVLTP